MRALSWTWWTMPRAHGHGAAGPRVEKHLAWQHQQVGYLALYDELRVGRPWRGLDLSITRRPAAGTPRSGTPNGAVGNVHGAGDGRAPLSNGGVTMCGIAGASSSRTARLRSAR